MIRKRYLDINVVEAAKLRIKDEFAKGRHIVLSFSGGKDSIVLADIVLNLVRNNEVDKSLLTVCFVDEEAMYEDVIEIVKKWRQTFMLEGVPFEWYCIPVKHFNCLNSMSDEETFVCWDPRKKDRWVREMPSFAITDDKFLIPYKDNYQAFWDRKCTQCNMTAMIGIRVAESIQRYKNMARVKGNNGKSYPIYDMTDKDIWLYIYNNNLEIPKAYENLYRIGTPTNQLRISQFFSIDTAKSLVSLGEMYPDLMERVSRREPNAYLCALYWDTEMFGRTTRKRRQLEGNEIDEKDYRKLALDIMNSENPEHPDIVKKMKHVVVKASHIMNNRDWRAVYHVLITGDPKSRTCRAIVQNIWGKENSK